MRGQDRHWMERKWEEFHQNPLYAGINFQFYFFKKIQEQKRNSNENQFVICMCTQGSPSAKVAFCTFVWNQLTAGKQAYFWILSSVL